MEEIKWEITPVEKRSRLHGFILRTWWLFIIIGICAFTLAYPLPFFYRIFSWGFKSTFETILYGLLGIGVAMIFVIAFNSIAPYKLHSYILNETGINISKGKKSKFFSWNQFEFFYPYRTYFKEGRTDFGGGNINKVSNIEQEFQGKIIYLKQKSLGFIKSFVVVYTEPDNQNQVVEFLNKHLAQKEMSAASDLGLVFYKFK